MSGNCSGGASGTGRGGLKGRLQCWHVECIAHSVEDVQQTMLVDFPGGEGREQVGPEPEDYHSPCRAEHLDISNESGDQGFEDTKGRLPMSP